MPFAKISSAAALFTLLSLASATPYPTNISCSSGTDYNNHNSTVTSIKSVSIATVTSSRTASSSTTSAPVATSTSDKYFRLKTAVRPHQPLNAAKRFNHAYIWHYHTGAAMGDWVITPNPEGYKNTSASQGGPIYTMVNETKLAWDIEYYYAGIANPDSPEYQLGVGVSYFPPYSGWAPLSAGPEFEPVPVSFNKTTGFMEAQFSGVDHLAGFRVCDWSHGWPQVFALGIKDDPASSYFATTISTCADVDIVREFITFP